MHPGLVHMAARAAPRAVAARDGYDIVLVCQIVYWMSFIYKDAVAFYPVAMLAGTHTGKQMKNSATIRAVLTRFLRSSVLSPQNQGPSAAATAHSTLRSLRRW